MFEHEQDIVDTLLSEDSNFQRLHSKHTELNRQVDEANTGAGAPSLDERALEEMKKKKLQLRDQMAAIISEYKRAAAASGRD